MAFWEIVIIGVIGVLINRGRKDAEERTEEERRRTSKPCTFSDGISREQFEEIVKKSGKHIKRIANLSVDGTTVYGTVRAQSGLSEWNFRIDFNDYGHLTGEYWLFSDNDDSNIPKRVADNINLMVKEFPEGFEKGFSNTKTRQQAKIFKEKKRKRRRKKVKHFFTGLIVIVIVVISVLIGREVREYKKGIEVGISSSQVVGQEYEQVIESFEDVGFTNIHAYPKYDLDFKDIDKENTVSRVSIKGNEYFEAEEKYPFDAKVVITYHVLKNIYVPVSAEDAEGMNYEELSFLMKEAGFENITTTADYDLITGWIKKEYSVESVSINGKMDFSESSSFRPDSEVVIIYHRFKGDKE